MYESRIVKLKLILGAALCILAAAGCDKAAQGEKAATKAVTPKAKAESTPPPVAKKATDTTTATPTKTAGAKVPPTKPAFADTPFKISFSTVGPEAGRAAKTVVKITPLDGYKMNKDFPNSLKVDTPANMVIPKTDYSMSDATFSEQLLSYGIGFTPKSAGDVAMTGTANFSVCNERTCKLFRGEKLAWIVTVK